MTEQPSKAPLSRGERAGVKGGLDAAWGGTGLWPRYPSDDARALSEPGVGMGCAYPTYVTCIP